MSSPRRILVEGDMSVMKRTRFLEPPEPAHPSASGPLQRDVDPTLRDPPPAASDGLDRQPSSPFPLPSIFAEAGEGGGRFASEGEGETSSGIASSPFATQQAQDTQPGECDATPPVPGESQLSGGGGGGIALECIMIIHQDWKYVCRSSLNIWPFAVGRGCTHGMR